ncbi:MAG: hypothetical protein MI748_19345 [Opitutales bacterium]|nr:hypothetical protein [Opitutales bacterium]
MKKLSSITLTLLIASSPLLNAAFREDVTLHVPSEYATIYDALYDLDEKTISKDVLVTIQIADGTYNFNSPIIIEHPYSHRIQIIGNTASPSNCTLNFTGQTNGIEINTGIKLVDGLKITGTAGFGSGIIVDRCSMANLGANIEVQNFEDGINASNNSSIVCNGAKVRNCTRFGFYAWVGSSITAENSLAEYCEYGFMSVHGSIIEADYSSCKNNNIGYKSVHGSYIYCKHNTITGNTTDYDPLPNTNIPYYGSFIGQ